MRRLIREGLRKYRFLAAEETLLHRTVIAILTVDRGTGVFAHRSAQQISGILCKMSSPMQPRFGCGQTHVNLT